MTDFTHNELLRYSRQCSLPEVGLNGQKKLKNTSILCIGAGGIGSPALTYLAAAGIGRIGIIDDDVVELSNLQRQILYTTSECGKAKTEIAKNRLLAINENIEIQTFTQKLSYENALNLVENYQIVLDGSDNYSTKYLANDACYTKRIPLISASLFQFNGQLITLRYTENDAACYRCLYPIIPPIGAMQNCAESGILGSVAGMLGTMAATQAIKLVLNIGDNLKNQLLLVQTLTLEIKKYQFTKRKECILCGKDTPFTQLPRYEEKICSTGSIQEITPTQLQNALAQNKKLLIIDVRSGWERLLSQIPHSIHIPLAELEDFKFDGVDFNTQDAIVLYCKVGVRSEYAAKLLQQRGIRNVYNLQGGIQEWILTTKKVS